MFYPKSRPTAEKVMWSAYDHSDSIAEAVDAYKRCRTPRTFILTPDSPDLARHACKQCGHMLADPSPAGRIENAYIDYDPRTQRAWMHHYSCSWGDIMHAVTVGESVSGAQRAYAAAEGPGVYVGA